MVTRQSHATATAHLSGVRGRALVNAKQHHLVVDSPLNLGGPNEAINPIDLLMAALASHVAFVCERAAQELGIHLQNLTVKTTGGFDARGGAEEAGASALQTLDVRVYLSGPNSVQAQTLLEAVEQRCLVYTTLARAVPVQLSALINPDQQPDAEPAATQEVALHPKIAP